MSSPTPKLTTDPQDELFPVVDAQDRVIGKISRSQAHKRQDIIHRAVGIFIFDASDRLLIQKRSSTKDIFPGCWEQSVGGHVGYYSDDYQKAALRELGEELGITTAPDALEYLGKTLVEMPWEKEFWQVYKLKLDKKITPAFNPSEIAEIKYISLEGLRKMLDDPNEMWSERARLLFQKFLFNS